MKSLFYVLAAIACAGISSIGCSSHHSKGDTGWEVVGTAGFSDGAIGVPQIAFDLSDTPYVIYVDGVNHSGATVKKFDGTSWITVGTENFSNEAVCNTCIVFDSSGIPYVTYNGQSSGFAMVKKFYNSEWVSLDGSANGAISTDDAIDTSIAISKSGIPFVAYSYFNGGEGPITVMKLDGGVWSVVGTKNFSMGNVSFPKIALDPSGTPYVIYEDLANSQKATVMKYNGTDWTVVGTAGFSCNDTGYTDIDVDTSGTPYVVYLDWGYNGSATVKKFDGTTWVTVGNPGFTSGEAVSTTIAIDSSGTPYIAYEDFGKKDGSTVMKFNGTSWVYVGSPDFSSDCAGNVSLALNSKGVPYVVFIDGDAGKATVMKLK